ncbi:Ribonucleotide monophosphatase NagD [Thalassovita gelatinovora]|uniref:Ribonucleotide monophosphatase NagD n=1 Tax=Thalassovita gelatinovora TaxID=53501 RepID=A0A0P1FWR6_THAGE|nr:HAD family hydrolase [Thalassovita gelatinovora]QIZ81004.1 HAD hydrolase-like protein [Thalassovita gelatinovora]CUH65073.1 Ribonucleotide monophosphatase NagD [Thalassovita gelatinovora]SEP86858.1 Haloacid Dehalogenase Superfamily Class (subfamily) IIA [Thalassovita gelatinovora]
MPKPIRLRQFIDGCWPDRAAILADLDGCLLSGETVLPDVPELFTRCADRLWIVSNNSADTAQTLSARLAKLGLALPAERILLAGELTLRALAADRPGTRVALYVNPPLQALARELGLRPDRDQPQSVVLGRDTALSFADMARIAELVHAGVPISLTNPDTSHPGADGTPQPETGAIWAAIKSMIPQARMSSVGKPAPDLPREALRRACVTPDEAVFIGDTEETDGVAATAAGVDFVRLVRPGETPAPAFKTGALSC